MEQRQKTIRKLIAFAALVVVLAGLPHFLFDRKAATVEFTERSYGYLLPPNIGKFHAVKRWSNRLTNSVVEEGATYQDPTGKQTAQFDIGIHGTGSHNGAMCYLTRGMQLQGHGTEQVRAADSTANFDVGFIIDQSLHGADHSILFIASTECMTNECRQVPLAPSKAIQIIFLPSTKLQHQVAETRSIALSITFESLGNGETQDREQALVQLRDLISNFNLLPLRALSAE